MGLAVTVGGMAVAVGAGVAEGGGAVGVDATGLGASIGGSVAGGAVGGTFGLGCGAHAAVSKIAKMLVLVKPIASIRSIN
jgi:hypothetical protein